VLSKQTRRKRAFYLLFESLVRGVSLPQLLDLRAEQFELELDKEEVDVSLQQFLLQLDARQEEITSLILEKCNDTSRSIGNSDLAILTVLVYEMLCENLDLPVALTQGTSLSESFGATDESADFIYAVIKNIHADLRK
jgi:transcription termination factor NusB